MKISKKFLAILLYFSLLTLCFAQKTKDSHHKLNLGLRLESNANSVSALALAGGFTFEYGIIPELALGLEVLFSRDFFQQSTSITTMDALAIFRFYPASPMGKPSTGLYTEAQGGATILLVNDRLKYTFNIGVAMGYRFGFKNFYIEPEIRGGMPYILGVGFNFGLRV